MKDSINFEDLFDWSVESDRHYMALLQHKKEEEHEWEQWEEETKRKPAKITVINKEIYEATTDTWEVLRDS
jgi:hypothetical protein